LRNRGNEISRHPFAPNARLRRDREGHAAAHRPRAHVMAEAVSVAAATPLSDTPLPVSTRAPPASPEPKVADKGDAGDLVDEDPALLARLAHTVKRFGGRLARASTPKYLRRKLATSEGTDEVYANLQREVASPGFLARLRSGAAATTSDAKTSASPADSDDAEAEFDAEENLRALCDEASLLDDTSEYVFVETEDVISAIAEFVAAYVTAHPQAAAAAPEKLQKALGVALAELRGGDKSKVRRVWEYGVGVYRGASWTYATLTSFTNPWIARLIVCAVYTGARLSLGAAGAAAAAAVG
jgi:hypothetical protein